MQRLWERRRHASRLHGFFNYCHDLDLSLNGSQVQTAERVKASWMTNSLDQMNGLRSEGISADHIEEIVYSRDISLFSVPGNMERTQ